MLNDDASDISFPCYFLISFAGYPDTNLSPFIQLQKRPISGDRPKNIPIMQVANGSNTHA